MTRYLTRNQASLYLGAVNCLGTTTDSAGNVFTVEAMADGVDWGSAQPIEVAVQRWMTDGAIAATQGYENREITFQVKISAATSVALAAGEAALIGAAQAALTLSWVPAEGSALAPTTVFDLWTCYLAHQFDPGGELRLTRTYPVTAVPTSGAGTVVSVDTGTSTTGWTGSPNAPSVFNATAIRESASSGSAGAYPTRTLTRTGSVTGMGTTPYLVIDARSTGSPFFESPIVTVDGAECTLVASIGTTRYYQVPVGVTSFTTLTIKSTHYPVNKTTTITLDVHDVTRSSVVGPTSTHKMFMRNLSVGGSVPTSGSIQVASPSATVLGTTLVYTAPDTGSGYSPAMRQYRTSGGTVTVDATMVSGSRETLNLGVSYDPPAGVLRKATYAVVARLNFTAAGNETLTFSTFFPNNLTALEQLSATASSTGASVQWVILGNISIPGTATPVESLNPTHVVISGALNSGTAPTLDEVFLLDVTHGTFSLVTAATSLGTAYTYTRLWLDSPDADQSDNQPHIYFGANADRSDAAQMSYGQIKSIGDHDLDPNGSLVFTVTDGVDDAVVTATYYPRWHTHAGA
jgi:hypothetical protein